MKEVKKKAKSNMAESSLQQVTATTSSASSFQELLESGRFKPEIWNSFSDSGLIMLVCFKLEMLLTELLVRFCNDTHQNVVLYYLSRYPADPHTNLHTYEDLEDKQYHYLLTTCCKMTLGNLIHEVFYNSTRREKKRQKKYGRVAERYDLGDEERDIFDEINKLRNEVAHFGADTNSTCTGRLKLKEEEEEEEEQEQEQEQKT